MLLNVIGFLSPNYTGMPFILKANNIATFSPVGSMP